MKQRGMEWEGGEGEGDKKEREGDRERSTKKVYL